MKTFLLQADVREEQGKKVVNKLRKEDKLPGILYGHGIKNAAVTVDYRAFEKVYQQAGASSLVDLQIGKHTSVKVLIQDIQRDPVTDKYIHVDFRQVKMTEKIKTQVELKFFGESKAVKEEGGILVRNMSAVTIECLPENLVHEIEVDISPLNTFDDIIRIKDLACPNGVSILEKGDTVVASVQPPRTEEELKSLEETVEEKVGEVEKVEKEKEEGEEAGEEAATEETAKAEEKSAEKKSKEEDKK